jgi:hypothetical protein
MRNLSVVIALGLIASGAATLGARAQATQGAQGAQAQGAQAAMTLRGEIVELSCFAKGVAQGTGPAHVACAKECVQKGQALGILTEDDGLVKITGDYAANKYAKLVAFVGKQVELRGTADRYLDYSRAIKVTSVTAARQKP